ncbi:hypothetical protein BS333_07310 [Vibrio azureus]|uniref:Putative type III secretion system outer membrane protein n=1 Tax=Vibrio azureus NBRC 104587 TaxID=1219077 RepID=U3AVT9_9VIBR|nr:type III secretion system gatekeeper subunit SctW [Vibrio azureus]AUI86211.1 hypothetical protein BS333_07310 [Vibrio azureus]GAD77860.1 putative type III secretion system outer membrane protein [Vibrio azureus NBRC 104587]
MFNQSIQTNTIRNPLADNSSNAQGGGGATVGNYRGQQVHVQQSNLSFFDALEELTVQGASKGEKLLSDYKVKDGRSRDIKLEELVSRYLERVPDIEKNQKIKDLATAMAGGNIATIRQMQTFLDSFSEEKSHQYLALKAVDVFLKDRPESQHLAQLVAQAISDIEQDTAVFAPIKTEIRISSIADQFSEDEGFSSLQQLRGFYRDTVHGYQGLNAVFNDVVNRFGEAGIVKAIDFLMQGMSADLSVQGSNIESTKLKLLMSDMNILKTLNTLQEQVGQLYQQFAPQKVGYGV